MSAWVSDQLHHLLGVSDVTTEKFIMSLAQKAKSSTDIFDKLLDSEFPANQDTRVFANQLFEKFGTQKKQEPIPDYKLKELEAIQKRRKNESYQLVDEDHLSEDNSDKEEIDPKQAKFFEDLEKIKNQRIQLESYKSSAEVPDQLNKREDKELKKMMKEKDKLERDAMIARMLEKDKEQAEKKKIGGVVENSQIAAMSEKERLDMIPELRKVSRQKYLELREEQQLDLFKRKIEDEYRIFGDQPLTEIERRLNELNQRLYSLAEKRRQKETKSEIYRMPDAYEDEDGHQNKDKRMAAALKRYEEEKKTLTEQEQWEVDQQKKAAAFFGTKKLSKDQKNYELLLENQVDFIQSTILAGIVDNKSNKLKNKLKKKNKESESEGSDSSSEIADIDMKEADKLLTPEEKARLEMQQGRDSLPVFPYRDDLLKAIRDHQVIIIVGETGSGKTTQIPQYLHEIGYTRFGKIGVTQPRRVAAMSVAARVAQEMNVKLGHEVGYSIRFEDCTSDKTLLKYMTDGMLLREFLGDPKLTGYTCLMIDEAHERTLHTDILFGLVKDVARYRKDLKLLISSATLDAEKFSDYFDGAPIFKIPGRRYPVDIYYTKSPEADYVEAAVITALQIHVTQPAGDILIFLTGQEEIETCQEMLQQRTRGLGTKIAELIICPIYATLPSDMQAKIFEPTPPGARKVVIATNIAETSLTINGIIYVIDCGFAKQTSYNPRTGMESLIVTPISKASANQRAGRAGRVAPGKCFRLYTVFSYQQELDETTIPEIQRTNLGNVVLMLKSLGINDLIHFDFMDPPPAETLIRALEQLYALGALNDEGDLTKLGRRMAEFPLDPMLSKSVIQAEAYKCVDQALTVCCMLSVGNSIFYRPKEKAIHADNARKNFFRPGGDHMTLLNVFEQWKETNYSTNWCFENFIQMRSMKRARDIKEQLVELCKRVEIDYADEKLSTIDDELYTNVRKAFASGFFYNTAKLSKSGNYKTLKNQHTVHIHPSSSMFETLPKWVIYHELVFTTKEFMRNIIEITPEWLLEIAPHYYKKSDIMEEEGKKKVKMPGTAK
ncbi:hypothetical protein FGO68_gene10396 [Halteria grandinella]|uniref:RNA helicase n=1 Tax=Halteria grandinella TaxID=5974 RepID=A0A8J8P043_HALGN|nr:hypothetical protein FGO68_gene10396 [Halteria grandinella]